MANKQKQPVPNYAAMSRSEFQSVSAGGNVDKPLYEFDSNGIPIYHAENLKYYTPSVIVKDPVTGRDTTATHLLNQIKNYESDQKAVESMYNSLSQYNHSYNVNAKALQTAKSVGTFVSEAALTAAETAGNIVNAVHSTGRTIAEGQWKFDRETVSQVTKDEIMGIFDSLGSDEAVAGYVKYHNFDNDTTISDDARKLLKSYRNLLEAREKDEMWGNVLRDTLEGARNKTSELVHGEYQGNRYQNIEKIAKFSGQIAGSLGAFKAAGIGAKVLSGSVLNAAKITRAQKLIAAATKMHAVSGSAAVYSTSFLNQFDSLRLEALAAGKSYSEALSLAAIGGALESLVEGWGFSKFGRLSAKKSLFNILKTETIPEAVQEATQTFNENLLTKLYGINSKTITDIAEEIALSALGGAIGGSAVGLVDYANGQARTRIAAARSMYERERQKAFEAAKAKPANQEVLQKNKVEETNAKAAVEQAATEPAVVAQAQTEQVVAEQQAEQPVEQAETPAIEQVAKTQEQAEQPKEEVKDAEKERREWKEVEDAFFSNEERILQENDPEYKKEVEAIQERFDNNLKEILTEKLKKVNANMTQEQIDNSVALLTRIAKRLNNDDAYGAALDFWAESVVKWSNEQAPNYQKNLSDLDKRFGLESLGLTTQDVEDLKSGDRIKRFNSEWKVVKNFVKLQLKSAGVSSDYAEELSNTFEDVFGTVSLVNNISPSVLWQKFAPRIIGLNRASFNNQSIEGYNSLLNNIAKSGTSFSSVMRSEAENILDSLQDTDDSKEAQNSKELALAEIKGLDETKSNMTAEDFINALTVRARMEQALAEEMGVSYGNELSDNDYKTIALMRIRGASQDNINEAFNVVGHNNGDTEFEEAANKIFPPLSDNEKKEVEKILSLHKTEKPNSQVRGAYAQPSLEQLDQASQKPIESATEGDNLGGAIMLTESQYIDKIAAEEFFHALSLKMQEAAKIQAVKDAGTKFINEFSMYSMGLLPEVRPLARLFSELTQPIDGIELTDRQKHETIAEAFVKHIDLQVMKKSQKEAFNNYENEKGDVLASAEDSKYQKLSAKQKAALGERFTNLLKPTASAELIAAGNKLANITVSIDIEGAKKLAKEILDNYSVYQDAMWANMLSKIDFMQPHQQLDFLQNMSLAVTQQGYDLLNASTIDLVTDQEGREVLIKKAIQDNSQFWTGDKDTSVYYNSIALPLAPAQRARQYQVDNKWLNKIKSFVQNQLSGLKPIWQNYVESLSQAAFNADPIIGSTIRRAMYEYGGREIELQKLASIIPLLMEKHKKMLKFSEQEFEANFKYILGRGEIGDREKAKNWIVKQFEGTGDEQTVAKAMDEIVEKLESLYNALAERGVRIKHLGEYWPTYVKDRQGLAEYLGYADEEAPVKKRMKIIKENLRKNYPGADDAKLERMTIDAINSQWHKYSEGEQISAFQERGTVFSTDTVKFYDGPFEALARYFENANRTIMMRELTGRIEVGKESDGSKEYIETSFSKTLDKYYNDKNTNAELFNNELTGKLGKAFYKVMNKESVNWKALDNFAKQMKRYVNRSGEQQGEFIRYWIRTNAMLLGNYSSMLNQFKELSLVLKNFGMKVTNDAIEEAVLEILNDAEGTIGANLENIHVQALQELIRYKDNDMLSKLTDIAHIVSGFRYADVLMKNIETKAVLKAAQQTLLYGNDKAIKTLRFERDFNKTFPKEIYTEEQRNQVIEDLKQGNLTDDVKFFIFNYISDVQPINSAEVPNGINTAGSLAKTVYQYRTTQLKQLEYVAQDIKWAFEQVKLGKLPLKDALADLLGFFMFFGMLGIPVGVLQALLRGQKPDIASLSLTPFDVLQINEYTLASMRQKGIVAGLASDIAPSYRILDDAARDMFKLLSFDLPNGHTVKDLPIFGPLMYYWFLGGREYSKRHGKALFYDNESRKRYNKARKAVGGK